MMRHPRRLTGLIRLLTAFFILFNAPALAAESAKRVLILPLTIHSEKDLAFLNKGIMDMIASRVGATATVIRKDALAPGKDALQMGRDLNADYVVTGSLTLFGNSASTVMAGRERNQRRMTISWVRVASNTQGRSTRSHLS